ncbi:MAG TPA: efflux RND transporter periplasmic adaptor subunit [Candidatus Dormibacteraeota bacterium]|nr:efflux RND transporter periplasmic adaptor subunit [Candidatus Dormibacteraeota bacterium]
MRQFSLIAALAGGILAFAGCTRGAAQPHQPAPSVTVAPVERKELVEWAEFTGRTEALESVEVRPRVSGYIQEVRFKAGELVKKGDVLFVIDPRWHQAEFDRRAAEVEQAKVHLENAQREAARTSNLLTNRAISIEEADARQARFQEAKAALLAAEAARDTAKLDLEYTSVRAPISGRVSRALLTEGNYVNGVAGGATLLTTLVSVDPVYVYADVDENSLLKFNALAQAKAIETDADGRIPVELELGDEQDFAHRGHIESFDNHLDANTGSILLRAVFSNRDGRIVPGLFARIRVPLSERHPAMLVDERAIGTDQGQKFVFTLSASNTVEYRAVKPGPLVEGKRIIRSGLEGSETVVVNGVQRVRPGMPVEAQPALAATSSGQTAAAKVRGFENRE